MGVELGGIGPTNGAVVVVVDTGNPPKGAGEVVLVVVDEVVEVEVEVDVGELVVDEVGDVGELVVVVVELLGDSDVEVGPAPPSLIGAAPPRSADSMLGSFPSMPRAQIPTPARLALSANWAAS